MDRRAHRLVARPALRAARRAAGFRRGPRRGVLGTRPPRPARHRDRRDGRDDATGRAGGTAALPARGLHADRCRALRRGRRLAPLHRLDHRGLPRLVPSEFSSGARRVQGGITKTGNGHARRLLVEAAWHHRRPLRPAGNAPAAPTARAPRCGPAPRPATAACTNAGAASSSAANARRCRWSPLPASSPAGAGVSRCSTRTRTTRTSTTSTTAQPPDTRLPHKPRRAPGADAGSAWSDPRSSYEQLRPMRHRAGATLAPRSRNAPDEHPVMR